MVGSPTCPNMTLVFNADKTWSRSSSNEKDFCDGSGNFSPSTGDIIRIGVSG